METKRALPILFAVIFLVMVGFGIIIPIIPFYAEDLGASPFELGLLMAIYSFMQLLFAPIWGRISDRIGRKPVMMAGILGLSISFFLMALSTELWMLFAARFIGGVLSAANMPTAMAYVADITTEENRGKGMGVIGAATGLGFIFGPAIGGIFSKTNLTLPFYVAGILSLLTFFVVMIVLKESLPLRTGENNIVKRESFLQAVKGLNGMLYFMQFFISLSLAGLEATFAYFVAKKAGLTTLDLGYIFMIMGLAQAFVQGGLLGTLSKKFGDGGVIQMGIWISAAGFSLILLTNSFLTAAIYLTIFGVGNGLIRPGVSSLLTKTSAAGHGSTTGFLSSVDSFGRIAGPPIGGWLYSIGMDLPYIAGIILSIAAFFIFRFYQTKMKERLAKA